MQSVRYSIIETTWKKDQVRLLSVRRTVFVEEQNVPEEIEVDDFDPISIHVLAVDSTDQTPIGTARLLPDGRIGRVAVLKESRKAGVGMALMKELISIANRKGFAGLHLHAQTWTIGFYEKLGFTCEGAEFDEAGIAHRSMHFHFE